MRRYSFALLALATLAVVARPAAGQDRVEVRGTVVDEQTGEPVPAVDIIARGPHDRFLRAVTSDEDGTFTFTIVRSPGIRLFASRLGYQDNTTPILYFDGHDFFEVEVRLDPEAVLLAPLAVLARSEDHTSPVLEGFQYRLKVGSGYYITRQQIESTHPAMVSDLLARVPGIRLGTSGSGRSRIVTMARSAGRDCPVQVFMDGMLVTKRLLVPGSGGVVDGLVVDDVVTPNSVEGIEVYRGLSTVPPEFLTPEADCGVIAIWTRRGGD